MKTASLQQAQSQLSRLIETALAGEEVIIARAGTPLVRLVPVKPTEPRRTNTLKEFDAMWARMAERTAEISEEEIDADVFAARAELLLFVGPPASRRVHQRKRLSGGVGGADRVLAARGESPKPNIA